MLTVHHSVTNAPVTDNQCYGSVVVDVVILVMRDSDTTPESVCMISVF